MRISIFIGSTAVGNFENNIDIAFANTAKTSHVNDITKIKNITLTLLLITFDEISAIDLPFSFKLSTKAPKSCTAPMKTVPITIHKIAGSHPQ